MGDVLSVVTGVVLSPRGPLGVQALYAHLLGRPVPLGEAQAMYAEVRGHVLMHLPALANFAAAEVPLYEFVPEWLGRRAEELGTYLVVPPLPPSHALRRKPALPAPVQAACEAEANGGWASMPVSWLRFPAHDPMLGWMRPELAPPSAAAAPRTTGLGGSGRSPAHATGRVGERGVVAAPPPAPPRADPPAVTPDTPAPESQRSSCPHRAGAPVGAPASPPAGTARGGRRRATPIGFPLPRSDT